MLSSWGTKTRETPKKQVFFCVFRSRNPLTCLNKRKDKRLKKRGKSYQEQKNDKENSNKGIWWWECPGSIPGINSGRARDTRDVWADLCGHSHSKGRMSAGQTGQMTGQMGHVHGTDGTQTRGCPARILYVYGFFLSPNFDGSEPSHPHKMRELKPKLRPQRI